MKTCYNCGSEDIQRKEDEKIFSFRGEKFTIPVAITYCGKCGEVFNRETESNIIKRLGKAYIKKHKLMTPREIGNARRLLNLTVQEMDKKLEFSSGTIKALESGFTITFEQDAQIKELIKDKPKKTITS